MYTHLLIPTLIILGILLIISAFFSAAETALMTLNRIRLRHLVEKKIPNAKTVSRLVSNLETLLASVLIGNNVVNTGISILGGVLFVQYFGQEWGIIIGTFVLAFVILFLGEILPKTIAAQRTVPVALFVAQPMRLIVNLFSPISKILNAMVSFTLRVIVRKPLKRAPLVTEEELKLMIELGGEEGILADDEKRMLHRIFEFGDTKVDDIMVPAKKIVSVDINIDKDKLLQVITEEGFSRLPVYSGKPENIEGVIYARELLHLWQDNALIIVKDLVHPVHFVKKDKKVIELLREFQAMHLHIAIVIDDKNSAMGLVTMQDLLEEIVGEIEEGYRSKIA